MDVIPAAVVVAARHGGEPGRQVQRSTDHRRPGIMSGEQTAQPAFRRRTVRIEEHEWITRGGGSAAIAGHRRIPSAGRAQRHHPGACALGLAAGAVYRLVVYYDHFHVHA